MKVFIHILAVIVGVGAYFALPLLTVSAACTTQYGGTVSCPPTDLTINKFVAEPRALQTTETKGGVKTSFYSGPLNFKDNLGIEQAFGPSQEIVFKLVVHNDSVKTFSNVRVVDKIPDFVKLDSYPGTIEDNGKSLVYFYDTLGVGETREQEIFGHIVSANELTGPKDFCELNRGEVSADDRAHNDSAQFCVSKEKPARQLPVAGFNDLALMLPFLGAALGGFALIKKSK